MNKRNFISFLLSVAFGLSMMLYASSHIMASSGNAGLHSPDSARESTCPVYKKNYPPDTAEQCPAMSDFNCPGIAGYPDGKQAVIPEKCPALRKNRRDMGDSYQIHMLSHGSNCPYQILEKIHRSAYIFIASPDLKGLKQGKFPHEIRI